jgi:hypothetical protein
MSGVAKKFPEHSAEPLQERKFFLFLHASPASHPFDRDLAEFRCRIFASVFLR